jgi:hypothetical protein
MASTNIRSLRIGGLMPLPPPDEAFPSTVPFLHQLLDQVVAECHAEGVPAYGTFTARGVYIEHGHLVPALRWQLALSPPPGPEPDPAEIGDRWPYGPDFPPVGIGSLGLVAGAAAGYSTAVQLAILTEQQTAYDTHLQEANDALPTHLSPMPGVRRARRGRHLMGPRKMGQGGWLRTVFGASPKGSPVKHKGCLGNLWLIVAVAAFGMLLASAITAGQAVGA